VPAARTAAGGATVSATAGRAAAVAAAAVCAHAGRSVAQSTNPRPRTPSEAERSHPFSAASESLVAHRLGPDAAKTDQIVTLFYRVRRWLMLSS